MSARKLLLVSAVSVLSASVVVVAAPADAAFAAAAPGSPRPSVAPLNPAFARYLSQPPPLSSLLPEPGGHAKGFVPSPVDLPHLSHQRPNRAGPPLFRASPSFDLRTAAGGPHLTDVRAQGYCGACWAFATFGSLESSLMPGETWDFSENNLKNNHGFLIDSCGGGNREMSTAYLTRWNGPVRESDDPYVGEVGSSPTFAPVKLVEEVLYFGTRDGTPGVDDAIKSALEQYKVGITVGLKMDMTYFDSTNNTYLYRGTATDTDHMVVIVGWDDNFDKNKFSPPANNNGAYIIRNSWGAGWGEGGYFYVSYEDPLFGQVPTMFLTPAPVTKYDVLHDYDPYGLIGNTGFNSTTAWIASRYTAGGTLESEKVLAFSFYALSANTTYEWFVYRDPQPEDPRAGTLVAQSDSPGTLPYAGYHTVALPGVVIPKDHAFSVVVKITTPDYTYPVPFEGSVDGYATTTAEQSESFLSPDGETWDDMVTLQRDANIAMRVMGASSCDDGNACTEDASNGTGCTHTPLSGVQCDDGVACTDNDTCDNGVCKGTDACAPTAAACHETNHCNLVSGQCEAPALADGTACDDGDRCTEFDRCEKGQCQGLEVICKVEECWVGRCDATAPLGCVKEQAPDGTGCSGGGSCRAGICQRPDALQSYSCGSAGGGPATGSLLLVAAAAGALALRRRRAA